MAIGIDDIRAMTAPARPLSSRSGPSVSMDCAGRRRGHQDGREGRDATGDGPRQGGHPLAGMPSRQGGVGVVGRGSHGDADPVIAHEAGRARRAARGAKTSIAMYGGPNGSVPIFKVVGRPAGSGNVKPLTPSELMIRASTRMNWDRPSVAIMPTRRGPPGEAAYDRDLDPGCEGSGDEDRHREGDPVGRPPVDDQQSEDRGAEGTDGAVGEVHEPAGAIDQDQADGEQAVGQAGEHTDHETVEAEVEAGHSDERGHGSSDRHVAAEHQLAQPLGVVLAQLGGASPRP